ncbi:MAG: Rieske (2Fe-2S) protein [Micromonosporaceae bacterium]
MTGANRRTVLLGAGAAGVTAAVAACGGESEDGGGGPYGGDKPEKTTPGKSPTGGDGGALAKVADVPVGGGLVLAEQKVVLTQPTKGKIMGFSGVCTHKGCALADVADGTINCKCHGSKFDPADGSVKTGPATKPLPAVEVTVEGEEVFKA